MTPIENMIAKRDDVARLCEQMGLTPIAEELRSLACDRPDELQTTLLEVRDVADGIFVAATHASGVATSGSAEDAMDDLATRAFALDKAAIGALIVVAQALAVRDADPAIRAAALSLVHEMLARVSATAVSA